MVALIWACSFVALVIAGLWFGLPLLLEEPGARFEKQTRPVRADVPAPLRGELDRRGELDPSQLDRQASILEVGNKRAKAASA